MVYTVGVLITMSQKSIKFIPIFVGDGLVVNLTLQHVIHDKFLNEKFLNFLVNVYLNFQFFFYHKNSR